MGPIGGPELLVLIVIVFLLFGITRLPQMGRSMGRRAREAQTALGQTKDALKQGYDENGPVVDAEVEEVSSRERPPSA